MHDPEEMLPASNGPQPTDDEIEAKRRALAARIDDRYSGKYVRVLLAALSGIPWIGSLLAAAATYQSETEQEQQNELQQLWLQEHEAKLHHLGQTLSEIFGRFEGFGEDIQARIQSDEYLSLVRKAFRSWDQADTEQKREFIKRLLTNAGGTKLCPDDLVRLFIDWVNSYHESHFAVIGEIYKHPGITRGLIWRSIHGGTVREDSAEADLFKLLIRDLSTGGVIRQHKETDYAGNFIRKPSPGARTSSSAVLKSAFDNTEQYELTGLGQQFVHYTMNELVSRIAA